MTMRTRQVLEQPLASWLLVVLMASVVFSPMVSPEIFASSPLTKHSSSTTSWNVYEQPWGQYAHTPTHNQTVPQHHPDGGPGLGNVSDVSILGTIEDPTINWQVFESGDGSDAYGSVIGDFAGSITSPSAAKQRCGEGTLFPVVISNTISDSGDTESYLNIISGNDAKIAWKASLGITDIIRSTPVLHDIDADGHLEVIVVYDTQGAMNIEVWSPRLTCTESGWQTSGHTNEMLWSYSDADVRIGSPSPHIWTANSGHRAVTQPLLADLELDGSPELVLAVVDDPDNNPVVYVQAYTLTTSQPSEEDWSVNLDRGTHPSDPVWAQLDSTSTSILLTTIDANSGNMWIWKIDGASGSLDWERVAVQGTDADSDAPRLKLPGPIIVQLDQDAAPEMVLTVPTDANGRSPGSGARFIGLEITSTTEIFNFRAPNGYADAQPLALDTDDDDIDDRLCWVTWYSESTTTTNRKGMIGCTDISDENPVNDWVRDLQRGTGNDNDEIAASPPFSLNLDGEGKDEILIGFGRRLWAFDGDTGASADINNEWSTPLAMPHRVWCAPALADVDGDGYIDILLGDTLVSDRGVDLVPALDNRGLSFNPAQADPGDTVMVTAQFSNLGTWEADDDVDAVIKMNGEEIARQRFTSSEPVAPSGEGGPQTFTAEFIAQLGQHQFELILDINNNITEQREDNNHAYAFFEVVEPYVAEISGPLETVRILPGNSDTIEITLTATGSRTGDWTLDFDTNSLPQDWIFAPFTGQSLNVELTPQIPQTLTFEASVPSDALGDESGFVTIHLSLDQDPDVNTELYIPIKVYRTRGIDLAGPTGLNISNGQGSPGEDAIAWFLIQNLGNAQETTTSITWTAPSWGGSPSLHDSAGNELFSITLMPGETRELFAYLHTPASAAYGSSSQTTLTMCMGSGAEALCESLPFTFLSTKFSLYPTHQRTLPSTNITWYLQGVLPTTGMVQWNMAQMGMLQPNWAWSASGDWVINGSYLESQGNPDQTVTGSISLTLPANAVPKRHSFFEVDDQDNDAQFNATLQVLQIYRSEIFIIEPLPSQGETSLSLNVSEQHRFLLFLKNPGNGEDIFELKAHADAIGTGITPEIDFTFFDPVKNLGPLSTGIGTVDIQIAKDTPALAPFLITFEWQSFGDENVVASVSLVVQAAPSHEWTVNAVNGTVLDVYPGQPIDVLLQLTNIGNADDELVLDPMLTVHHVGQDTSSWSASPVQTGLLGINQTTQLHFTFTVPTQAWAGTQVDVHLIHITHGFVIGQSLLKLEVGAVPGWQLNLTGADLEIDPQGENLTLQLVHTGNAYETPYFSKSGAGWNITLPTTASSVAPFETVSFVVFVEPPQDALAGEIGVLKIRITGNDTSGMIEEEIPVRVGAHPQIAIDHRSTWKVNEQGGMPTAWIENQGNDIAILALDIPNLPEGWSTEQGKQVVLAPGEFTGVPLSLLPNDSWNKQRFLININVFHPLLGTQTHSIEVEYSGVIFTTSPVLDAFVGTVQSLRYSTTLTEGIEFTSQLELSASESVFSFVQPQTTGQQVIQFSSDSSSGNLTIYAISRTFPDASLNCVFASESFSQLGREALNGVIAQCELDADETEDLNAVFTLVTSTGLRVPLSQDFWHVPKSQTLLVNLTVNAWDPPPGFMALYLKGYDQFGRVLMSEDINVISRQSGWNIGINSLTANGDITVGIKRTGYSVLQDAICELHLQSDGGWTRTFIVDIAYSDFAPVISISNPQVLEKDEKITASISCNVPFDIDDDAEDDVKSTYYKTESILTVSSSDFTWILAIALILFTMAWYAGIIKPAKAPKAGTKTAPISVGQNPKSSVASKREEAQQKANEDTSISFEDVEEEQRSLQDIENGENTDLPSESMKLVEIIPVQELQRQAESKNASRRLAHLRKELGTDDGPELEGTVEERMRRFFGGE